MSLSEAPSIKITFSTPQDIADEILGGTISFCKETGYKQSIKMIAFLWSGFLLSFRMQLDEHGLVENILNCYTRSLSKVFPKLTENASLKEQAAETLQHYWEHLSRDFKDLRDKDEASVFLQIANKINSQDDTASAYLLNKDPKEAFAKVLTILQSSIYRILYQIDNGLGIEYRSIVQSPLLYQQINVSQPASQEQSYYVTNRTTSARSNCKTIPWRMIFLVSLFVLFIVLVLGAIPDDADSDLTAIPEPRSGAIFAGREYLNESELTITASGSSSYVVKLKTSSGATRLSFYIRAGDTVTIGVPAEYLYVYFASGNTWYGEKYLFGSKTSYSMDDEVLDFTKYTWEYTLYPVNNGNFSETPIDPGDF